MALTQLPAGSRLELWTEGSEGEYESVATIIAGDPAHNRRIAHSRLINNGDNAPSYTLSTPQGVWLVRFHTKFLMNEEREVELHMRAVQPDSTVVDQEPVTVRGRQADPVQINFFGVSTA